MGATNTVNTRYIRGLNLVARKIDTNLQYYQFNYHGDVQHLLSSTGTVLINYRYDGFGNQLDAVATDTNPFRYCGEYFDRETGTYYLRARNYDPWTGRFTTEDRAKDGLNWYVYCENNPIIYVDPVGMAPAKWDIQKQGWKITLNDWGNSWNSVTAQIGKGMSNFVKDAFDTGSFLLKGYSETIQAIFASAYIEGGSELDWV